MWERGAVAIDGLACNYYWLPCVRKVTLCSKGDVLLSTFTR